MNVPHIVFEKDETLVITSPPCQHEEHDVCRGRGHQVKELNLFVVHLQWNRPISCACMCHIERRELE